VANRREILPGVKFLYRLFQSLEPQDQGCDVVKRPAGSSRPDYYFHTVSRGLVLIVLTSALLRLVQFIGETICLGLLLGLVALASLEGITDSHLVLCVNLLRDALPDGVDAIAVVESLEDAVATDHDEVEVFLHLEALDIGVTHNYIRVSTVFGSLGFDVAEGLRYGEAAGENAEGTLHVQILLSWVGCSLGKCLCSINLSASSLNSDFLHLIIGLVIS